MTRFLVLSISIFFSGLIATDVHAQAVFDAKCAPEYNNQYFAEKPTPSNDLCLTGNASGTIEGDGSLTSPWKWHCFDESGNQGEKCLAYAQYCGNGRIEGAEECDGGDLCTDSCEVIASCNESIHGNTLDEEPSSNLCSTGSQSTVTGSGSVTDPWVWTCENTRGDVQIECNATKKVEATKEISEPEQEREVEKQTEPETETVSGEFGESGNIAQEEITQIVESVQNNPVAETAENTQEAPQEVQVPQGVCEANDYSDIKGHIWHDDNRNGIIDANENGIEDVTVELYNSEGEELEEDKTDDDGKFRFENYAPGKYTIDVKGSDEDLDGYKIVYENDANRNGRDQIKLKCDNNHTKTLFGYDTGGADDATSRPRTLAQTGGSILEMILNQFIR